jgi:hypothetical protein
MTEGEDVTGPAKSLVREETARPWVNCARLAALAELHE